jgi:hypothetical protein
VNNPNGYPWHALYASAVLETDSTRMPKRIDEVLTAIKDRGRSLAEISDVECAEMEAARTRLAILRAERSRKHGVKCAPPAAAGSSGKTVAN